jgi:hypothetical protein
MTSNVTVTTGNAVTNISVTTGDQLVFKNIVTDSGTVVSDGAVDTLTLTGANGITTSANADTDTVTIDGSGLIVDLSTSSVGDLSDVDITTSAPTSNQILLWNGTKFVPGNVSSGAGYQSTDVLGDLDDVTVTSFSEGDILVYDASAPTQFVNRNLSGAITLDGDGVTVINSNQVGVTQLDTANIDISNFTDTGGLLQADDLSNNDTDDLAQGSTNLYYADSLVDAHLSGGTGVTYTTGEIAIGQDVGTTADVTFNTVTATSQFEGDINGAVMLLARNVSGVTIYKGQAVYVNGLSGDTPTVILADASDPAKMPALGVARADINNNATGEIVTLGNLYAVDTSLSNQIETGITLGVGDVLYISATEPGNITNVAPTGESNQIQNIGKAVRVSPNTNMTFKIHGAGRSAATPALDSGNIFIGNGSNQASTTPFAISLDTTPQLGGDLDVNGNDIVSVSAGNIAIAVDSANSEGYSTATLDASSGHFFLKSGLVLDHPGTAGLEAKYSNYITVATTDGDLNMSSNGGGRIRPRSDFQIRGSDGCDLWLRSEYSTDAKISYRGGSTEQGALIVDRNNSLVKYYTDSWGQKMESTSGQVVLQADSNEIQLNSSGSNVRANAQDIILQANDDIDFRAADRFQFRSKDSGTSEYNETMSLFQNNSGYTGTAATGAVVESSSGKQSGDYDTSLVIRKFDEGDGGSTAHAGVEQRIAQYELTLEAGKSTLSLNYRDDDNTGAANNTATLLKFKNSTSETATAATQNAPDTMELNVDVVEHYSAKGHIITNYGQGSSPDLTSQGADFGTVYGKGIDIQADGSYAAIDMWSHKSNTGYPNIWAHRSRDDGAGNKDFLNNNDRVFSFLGSGWDGSADTAANFYGAFAPVGELILQANEDHSASARGGKWLFLTTSTGSTTQTVKFEVGDHVTLQSLLELKSYASTALPSGVDGALISISDNNYKPAYYNGSTWKYIGDDTDV